MPSTRVLILAALSAASAACSNSGSANGPAPAGNRVDGNVGGTPFVAGGAVFNELVAKGADYPGTNVMMTTAAGTCAEATSGIQAGAAVVRDLFLVLAAIDASGTSGPARSTGTYAIATATKPAPGSLVAQLSFEALCNASSADVPAASGAVSLTRVDASVVEGTFDVTLGTGEHVTGAFAAPRCDGFNPNKSLGCH